MSIIGCIIFVVFLLYAIVKFIIGQAVKEKTVTKTVYQYVFVNEDDLDNILTSKKFNLYDIHGLLNYEEPIKKRETDDFYIEHYKLKNYLYKFKFKLTDKSLVKFEKTKIMKKQQTNP